MNLHRNSQKRHYLDESIYFITTNTYQGYEYFREPIFCELFVKNLKFCKQFERFSLYAFCVLYNHVHLLLKPNHKYNISQIMFSLKKQFSHNINRVISPAGEQALVRLGMGM